LAARRVFNGEEVGDNTMLNLTQMFVYSAVSRNVWLNCKKTKNKKKTKNAAMFKGILSNAGLWLLDSSKRYYNVIEGNSSIKHVYFMLCPSFSPYA